MNDKIKEKTTFRNNSAINKHLTGSETRDIFLSPKRAPKDRTEERGNNLENLEIRFSCKLNGVRLEDLARTLGISEPTLYRRLRKPLTAEQRGKFLDAINKAKSEREDN